MQYLKTFEQIRDRLNDIIPVSNALFFFEKDNQVAIENTVDSEFLGSEYAFVSTSDSDNLHFVIQKALSIVS